MKMNKYITLLALPLAFTACQSDDVVVEQLEQPTQSQGLYKLYGAVQTDADSRAQVVLNNAQVEYEKFIWNEGDSITVYNLFNGNTEANWFTIDADYSEDNASSYAYFVSPTALDAGETYAAVYPTRHKLNGGFTGADVELELQEYVYNVNSGGWKDYFSDNMFMYVNFTADKDSSSISFEHLTSLARITYTNNTSETRYIQEVNFHAPGLGDYKGVNFSPTVNDLISNRGASALRVWFQDDLLEVKAGNSADIYILFFPMERGSFDETIKINVCSYKASERWNEFSMTTSEIDASLVLGQDMTKTWVPGGRYWFNITQNEDDLTWTNNLEGNYYVKGNDISFIEAIEDRYHGVTFKRNAQGWIDVEENRELFDSFNSIDLSVAIGQTLELKSISCLQYFTNLTSMNLDNVDVFSVDFSKNEKLDSLSCVGATIGYLNLNHNVNLTYLNCSESSVNQIRFAMGTKLTELICINSRLNRFDIEYCTSLKKLYCSGNKLRSLDITPLSQLETLECGNQTNNNNNVLQLILTESQKAVWDNTWSKDVEKNVNVTCTVRTE